MWGKKNGKWWEKYIAQFFSNRVFSISCFHSGQKSHQHQDLLAYTFARISLTKGTARLRGDVRGRQHSHCKALPPSRCPAGAENDADESAEHQELHRHQCSALSFLLVFSSNEDCFGETLLRWDCNLASYGVSSSTTKCSFHPRGVCITPFWSTNYREGKWLSPWPQNNDLNSGELRPRGCKQINFPWVSRETNLRTRSIFRRDVNNSLRNSKLTKLEPLVEIHPNFSYFMTHHAKRYQRKNYRRNSVFDSSFRLLFLIQVFF